MKEVETIKHALFGCPIAKLFWQKIKLLANVKVPVLHPSSWAIYIIDRENVDQRGIALIVSRGWSVWSKRTAVKHGQENRSIYRWVKWR
jgi:hypothetical protein